MTPQQQKAIDIAQDIVSAHVGIGKPFKTKIPDAHLLLKRPFPNRQMPHRIKRARKQVARQRHAIRIAVATSQAAMAAANIFAMMARPAGASTAPSGMPLPINQP